jgi:hypothetical protein
MSIQTITGFFDDEKNARQAARDLEIAGVSPTDVSIIANQADQDWEPVPVREPRPGAMGTGASIGAVLGGGAGLLAGLGMLAIPGLGPVVVAGWLAATGAVAGAAAGGLVAALTDAGVSSEHARIYAEGVRRGGSLVAARVDDGLAPTVHSVLMRNGAVDPGTRGLDARESGRTMFDEFAPPPYTTADIDAERARYLGRFPYR